MKTEIARRCLSSMIQAMQNELGCKGKFNDDLSCCEKCVMFYKVFKWDDEATGCRIQDIEKSLDWIEGGVY